MPRKPASPTHKAACSPAQKEAVKLAASFAGWTEAEFIRMALDKACIAYGVRYPDDLPKRGGYDRSQIDWVALSEETPASDGGESA